MNCGSLAQSVEQWTVNPCVAGSSPAGGVLKKNYGSLAQLVEQWTVNPCVAGSKPAAAA